MTRVGRAPLPIGQRGFSRFRRSLIAESESSFERLLMVAVVLVGIVLLGLMWHRGQMAAFEAGYAEGFEKNRQEQSQRLADEYSELQHSESPCDALRRSVCA